MDHDTAQTISPSLSHPGSLSLHLPLSLPPSPTLSLSLSLPLPPSLPLFLPSIGPVPIGAYFYKWVWAANSVQLSSALSNTPCNPYFTCCKIFGNCFRNILESIASCSLLSSVAKGVQDIVCHVIYTQLLYYALWISAPRFSILLVSEGKSKHPVLTNNILGNQSPNTFQYLSSVQWFLNGEVKARVTVSLLFIHYRT